MNTEISVENKLFFSDKADKTASYILSFFEGIESKSKLLTKFVFGSMVSSGVTYLALLATWFFWKSGGVAEVLAVVPFVQLFLFLFAFIWIFHAKKITAIKPAFIDLIVVAKHDGSTAGLAVIDRLNAFVISKNRIKEIVGIATMLSSLPSDSSTDNIKAKLANAINGSKSVFFAYNPLMIFVAIGCAIGLYASTVTNLISIFVFI